jgi:hypothetical protein
MRTQSSKPVLACLCGGCAALFATAGRVGAADVPRLVPWLPPSELAEPAPAALTLVWYDVQNQLGDAFPTMASEVRDIFEEIGVQVAWRAANPGDTFGEGSLREIAVIGLAEDPSAARRGRGILGLVVRDAQPTRALWTFIGGIKRTLGIDGAAGAPFTAVESALLARAVARVVAHEVVHALAPDHPHADAGLMRHALSRSMLLGPRHPLGAECARSVQGALAGPPVSGPDPAPRGALSLAIR